MSSAAISSTPRVGEVSPDDYLTLVDAVERYPAFFPSMQAARWYIRNGEKNGLFASGAVVKPAGRFLVCVPRLVDWANHRAIYKA